MASWVREVPCASVVSGFLTAAALEGG